MAMNCPLNSKAEYLLVKIKQVAELAMKHGDEETKDIQLYKDLVDKIYLTQLHVNKTKHALHEHQEATSVAEFNQSYKNKVSEESPTLDQIANYKTTISKISAALTERSPEVDSEENDNELLEVTSEINTIDPITRRRMENPVKNRICNHSYEKSSILELIKMNPRLRCPVTGCSNQNIIKETDLEDNQDLLRILQRHSYRS